MNKGPIDPVKMMKGSIFTWYDIIKDLTPVFVDVEAFASSRLNMEVMSRTQYLKATKLNSISVAVGLKEPEGFAGTCPAINEVSSFLSGLAQDDKYLFVAHNASYDFEAMNILLNIPYPRNYWCTLLGQKKCFNFLHVLNSFDSIGYSLQDVARVMHLPEQSQKKPHRPNCSIDEFIIYNKQDVRVLQAVFALQMMGVQKLQAARGNYSSFVVEFKKALRADLQKDLLKSRPKTNEYVIELFDIWLEENEYEAAVECCPCDEGELLGAEDSFDVVQEFLASSEDDLSDFMDVLINHADDKYDGQLSNIFSSAASMRDYWVQMEKGEL